MKLSRNFIVLASASSVIFSTVHATEGAAEPSFLVTVGSFFNPVNLWGRLSGRASAANDNNHQIDSLGSGEYGMGPSVTVGNGEVELVDQSQLVPGLSQNNLEDVVAIEYVFNDLSASQNSPSMPDENQEYLTRRDEMQARYVITSEDEDGEAVTAGNPSTPSNAQADFEFQSADSGDETDTDGFDDDHAPGAEELADGASNLEGGEAGLVAVGDGAQPADGPGLPDDVPADGIAPAAGVPGNGPVSEAGPIDKALNARHVHEEISLPFIHFSNKAPRRSRRKGSSSSSSSSDSDSDSDSDSEQGSDDEAHGGHESIIISNASSHPANEQDSNNPGSSIGIFSVMLIIVLTVGTTAGLYFYCIRRDRANDLSL